MAISSARSNDVPLIAAVPGLLPRALNEGNRILALLDRADSELSPAVEAASWLGHSAQEHLRTYAHVVADRAELDYADLLADARLVQTPVIPGR
jgi:hypothetical protein